MTTHELRLKLDFKYWVEQKCHIFGSPNEKYIITDQHREAIMITQDSEFILGMAYRGWGKSELWSFLFTLWRAEQWDESAVIYSANDMLAKQKLDSIRVTCEFENPNFSYLCSKDVSGYIWNRDELWLIDKEKPIYYNEVTKTGEIIQRVKYRIKAKIYAKSMYSTARGLHVKNIILDDVVVDENSKTMDQMQEVINLFQKAIIPMRLKSKIAGGIGSRIIVIGTPQSEFDLLGELKANPKFKNFFLPALNEHGLASCPELHTIDWLMQQRSLQSPSIWLQEYMLVAGASDVELFTWELFNNAKRVDLCFEYSYTPGIHERVIIGPDFSVVDDRVKAKKNDTDFFSLSAIVLNMQTGKRRVLCFFNDRGIGVTTQIQILKDWIYRYNATYLCMELHGSLDWTRQMIEESCPSVQIIDTGSRAGKFDLFEGIPSMLYSWEQGLWEIPYGDSESQSLADILFFQLSKLNKADHDDLMESLFRVDKFCQQYDKGDGSYDKDFSVYNRRSEKKVNPLLGVWRPLKETPQAARRLQRDPSRIRINCGLRPIESLEHDLSI